MIDLLLWISDPRKEPLERLPLLVDGLQGSSRGVGVDAVLEQHLERDVIQRPFVGAREVHLRLLARLYCLSISRGAEAPLVARHDARKHPLRIGSTEVVAHARREFEELFSRLDADRVPAFVVLPRRAVAVPIEAGTNTAAAHVGAATLEVAS